jgi:hypothetical protein
MLGDTKKEEWLELCQQAVNEQDPQKLMALIAKIARHLQAKEQHLKGQSPATGA